MVIYRVERITRSVLEHKHQRQWVEKPVNVSDDHCRAYGAGDRPIGTRVDDGVSAGVHHLGANPKCAGNSDSAAKSDPGGAIAYPLDLYHGSSYRNYKSHSG